jgi:hypothetical protein
MTIAYVEHTLKRKTWLRPSTECYVKTAHWHCFNVTAIHKTESVEDDRLETDVFSASRGMNAADHHEVLPGPSVRIAPILLLSFHSCKLRHFHWLECVHSVGDLHSRVPQRLQALSHEDATPIFKTL